MSKAKWIFFGLGLVVAVILISLIFGKDEQAVNQSGPHANDGVHVSKLVEKNCMSCHAVDGNGKLERIEYVRKSPEGWAQTIARMERIHGVKLTDQEREQLIEDLSRAQGLAPQEAVQVQYWLANKPSYDEAMPDNPNVQQACISCHATGRFMAQRRTEEEWKNLKDFHLVMFPSIYLNHRQIDWPKVADQVLAYLAKKYPMDTPEWREWKGHQYDVQGKWKVVGFQGTRGYYVGDSEFKQTDNGYAESKTIRFLKDQSTAGMQGDVRMYTGYMVRAHYLQADKKLEGVYNVLENGKVIKGDWTQKDDNGITGEETYYKVQTEKPEVVLMQPQALKKGTVNQVTLYGMNLSKLRAKDLKLPSGVTVESLTVNSDEQAQLILKVQNSAELGEFSLKAQQAVFHGQLVVYDRVDYLKITPAYGVARMGGAGPMHKVSTQFVAYAYSNGKDGKQGTADDLKLDPVDAQWTLTPYPEGKPDNDLKYMGQLNPSGLYTPPTEGVKPEREYTAESVGSATVVAKATIDGRTLSARAHLISTVPDYNNAVW